MEYAMGETDPDTRKISTFPEIHGQFVNKCKQLSISAINP